MSTPGPPEDHGLRLVPLRGLRYVPEEVGSLAAVTSPPYDVVVRPDGLLHLESADPHNIVRLILPQADTASARHEQAADTLRTWLDEGVLAPDAEPALYVYEQSRGDLLQRGVIGSLALSHREQGVVLPHEDVMPHVVEDRAALMRATAANLEPLLLTYRSDGVSGTTDAIDAALSRPPLLSTITEDGFHHRLWSLTDPAEIAAVSRDLSHHQALIADGHHRWATYLRLQEEHGTASSPWDFGLVLLVDTARYPLQVRAIHRLLHRLPVSEALAAVGDSFRIRHLDKTLPEALEALAAAAASGNAFLLAGDGSYHLLDRPDPGLLSRTVRQDRPEAWRTLDATVLHETLLAHVWHIPDAPEDIAYIHDTEAAVEQAERHDATAVLMHPVREEVVRDLARQGVTMPRKSTSFGPKPATGLVLRSLVVD
ncbi:DUF1015 family protein [Streptomyces candidus]|uniref:Uncharacterized protein (DUF1015 family) n=1 Tax=Streptomyces candidus TaxID=67283 RepID=A0A7X0HFB8_9ACTN|nr:DUF1015 domain-containing protein [Streptomyces candidus]MBB6436580.1 uncharacterized protein (DUF1015 family) [Streptomyces candidus]GHH57223.1 hypothetical protein GCM10018773_64250 [Streptomyces candidus]